MLETFRDLVSQIKQNQFFGKQTNLQQNVNIVFKRAAKMVNNFGHKYLVNCTMREELNFISKALKPDSGIVFEMPITHLIPQIPTASIIGNSSLLSCGGYSTTLKFWWHLTFLPEITTRTLLHLKDNSDKSFISINCFKFVTIILNYCASLIVFATQKISDDPHPFVLCITDNMSAFNWTLHMSKNLIISRALARFFCGLLIGSRVGINMKWISTIDNKIADKLSRLKATYLPSTNSLTCDYSNLKQEHEELRACIFYQPSHRLLSLIWDILLTQNCPNLKQILKLRPPNLGKLCT